MDILVAGQYSNGKSFVAEYLCEHLNRRGNTGEWVTKSFAAPVKQIFMDAFGVDMAFIEAWKRVDVPPPGMLITVRKALQFVGDGFRGIQPDCWINLCMRDTRQKCISDGRYNGEIRYVNDHSGIVIVVFRPGYLNNDPNSSESEIRNIVEFCLQTNQDGPIDQTLPFHYFLRNDGTLRDLIVKIDSNVIPWIESRHAVNKSKSDQSIAT